MNKKILVPFKLIFAALGFSAIITEVIILVGRGTFNAANFFSFFTIESNGIAAIALLLSAIFLTKGKESHKLNLLRGGATLFMVTTGIVFSLLLANLDAELTAHPWDNVVLHYIMPIVLALDWLIDPPKKRLTFKQASVWLLFPIAYLAYSLVRGAIVGWYPYPFLNPANGGYGTVAVISVGITVVVLLMTWIVTRIPLRPKAV